ncbi:MAG TPA: hypothetical protein VF623_09975 [Segetibacter sp.]|jgi:hypothetical protein
MKKLINVVLIGLAGIFATTLASAQSSATNSRNSNQLLASDIRSTNKVLPLSNLKKTTNVALVNKTDVKKTAQNNNVSNLQFSTFLTNTGTTTFSEGKKSANGTSSIVVKQTTSSTGKVAVKEANITYDAFGIVSINMNIDKQKGKAFIDANLAKYGHPNNENVLDNFSWIIGDYVLEVLESDNNYTAIYKKKSAATQYINEGVSVAIR